ncbi:MAG: rod shape-determining protein RodA [Acidimicrobiia bacterium]|nr:rod shape-determining protein RodA [Acidimicrobiia bacterium]
MATSLTQGPAGRVELSDRRARRLAMPLRHVDPSLVVATLTISGLGLLMLYSATRDRLERAGIDPFYFVKRQGLAVAAGLVVMVLVMVVDYRKLRDFWPVVYGALLVPLVIVISPVGSQVRGTQAWIQLPGGFQFQPSELFKFGMVVGLAGYLHRHRGELDARRVIGALALAGAPIALVMKQPDLGTAMTLGAIFLAVLTVAGVRVRHLVVLGLMAFTGVVLVVQMGMLETYQVDRFTAFLNQGSDTRDVTYNLDQAKTAIGNGGLTGRGLFHGPQTNGAFVPENHTDFIFTAVGEQLGFAGSATLLTLFAVVVWRTWIAARDAPDLFGVLACTGVVAMFAVQVFENIGMTMGIMPVTGIPLPLVSYGGTSVVATFALVGLVANIQMRRYT